MKKIEDEIPRLRRYAMSLTRNATRAEDLIQDCLTRALSKVDLWQPGTDLRAWLFTILHNQYVNHVRRAIREGTGVGISDFEAALTCSPNQGKALELRDLNRALAKLPEEQRQVLLLVGVEGMRYEEVAAVLDIPTGTIRSRLSRGREMLRQLMDRGEESATVRRPAPRRQSGANAAALGLTPATRQFLQKADRR
jgi:RNA polymerase sigma-70 factor (ECF subfamily)